MKRRGKTYIILMIITIGCKVIGFLRESILAFFFGATNSVDAYKLAESLSSVLLGWMVAFSVAFVPIYSEVRSDKGVREAESYTKKVLIFVGLIAAVFVVIAYFASGIIISLGAPGFPADKKALTEAMYCICVFAYLIFAQVSILNNFLNCNDRYFSAGASALFVSITQIVFIVIAYYVHNPIVMAYGLPFSMLARYVFLRIRSKIGIVDMCRNARIIPLSEEVKATAKTALPLFLSEIVISANELIDNTFASGLSEGSVSVLSYANILSASFHTLITSAILTVFFTSISRNVAEKDREGEKKELNYTIDLLSTILIPFALFAVVFSKWGINLVYERGAFAPETTIKTAIAFAIYILGVPAISFRNMTVQYYQAYKRTRIPLALSVINIAINVVLNLILVRRLAYVGLALATTLSYYILMPLEMVLIKKLCLDFDFRGRARHNARLLLSTMVPCAIAGVVILKIDSFYLAQAFIARVALFLALLGFTAVVFFLMADRMKLIDLQAIRSSLLKKVKNN